MGIRHGMTNLPNLHRSRCDPCTLGRPGKPVAVTLGAMVAGMEAVVGMEAVMEAVMGAVGMVVAATAGVMVAAV